RRGRRAPGRARDRQRAGGADRRAPARPAAPRRAADSIESAAVTGDPDYVVRNRAHWDGEAVHYAKTAEKNWAGEPTWGVWDVPEADLGLLPPDMTGMDAVELGCGTAYVSAWLARRGARPIGIDNSPEQLATARRMQAEFGLEFPLHLG